MAAVAEPSSPSSCPSEVTSAAALASGSICNCGLETPDTGTPQLLSRSASISSDGGVSLPPSERSATREGPLRRQRDAAGGPLQDSASQASSAASGGANAPQEGSERRQGGKALRRKQKSSSDSATGGRAAASKNQGLEHAAGRQAMEQVAAKVGGYMSMAAAMPATFTTYQMGAMSFVPGAAIGMDTTFSDRKIFEVLAAPAHIHERLLQTAKRVPEILCSDTEGPALSDNVELYGSLSLDMKPDGERGQGEQDWASYYINERSDVDFVVEVRPDTPPEVICQRLQAKGRWEKMHENRVPKFASTQYTLRGSFDEDDEGTKVFLDITCIESPVHYSRFKHRQEAFRTVFTDVRNFMQTQFSYQGALAFDGYIHLLKAFAAKIPGNALTGFQATCVGLFTLQIGHYRFKHNQSMALSLFEGFLRFCRCFFQESPRGTQWNHNHHTFGIDLSGGGRWLQRNDSRWMSELYFMAAEVKMKTPLDERVNVLHSLNPARVAAEATALLSRCFKSQSGQAFHWIPRPQVVAMMPVPVLAVV